MGRGLINLPLKSEGIFERGAYSRIYGMCSFVQRNVTPSGESSGSQYLSPEGLLEIKVCYGPER